MILLGERPSMQFYIALLIVAVSTVLIVKDTIELQHTHGSDSESHDHQHGHELTGHDHTHTFIIS